MTRSYGWNLHWASTTPIQKIRHGTVLTILELCLWRRIVKREKWCTSRVCLRYKVAASAIKVAHSCDKIVWHALWSECFLESPGNLQEFISADLLDIVVVVLLLWSDREDMAEWDGASQWSNWRLNQEVVSTTVHSDCTAFSSSASDKGTTCLVLFPQLVGLQEGHPACKKLWGGTGVVICLERGADVHMAQLMPLPLTVSCFSEVQIVFSFLVPAHLGRPGQRAVKQMHVFVCVHIQGGTEMATCAEQMPLYGCT